MTANSKKIIILGGSYGAILALRTLLSRNNNPSDISLSISIISPNDYTYFNIATPRLLIEPESVEKVVFSIAEIISHLCANNPSHKVEHVQGAVREVDLEERKVYLYKSDISYDYDNLIVATGTRMESSVFKLDNIRDQNYSIQQLKSLVENIKEADSIAVVGGGITGVEVAAELASNYGKDKTIDLYTGNKYPLPELKEYHRNIVIDKLTDFGAQIINNEKVGISKDFKSITLSDGTKKEYSLIIPAFKHTPNTEFLPDSVLSTSGYVYTDGHLRLTQYHNVIVLGDILEMAMSSVVDLMYSQKTVFEATVDLEIFEQKSVQLREYQKCDTSYRFVVPLGKDGGIGAMFGFPLPNFVVRFAKARNYFIPKAKEFLG